MSACAETGLLPGEIVGLTTLQKQALIARLLYLISNSTDSVQELLDSASCFNCLSADQIEALKAELLCKIL